MGTQLESGAIRHMEDAVLEAAEDALAGQRYEVSATQAAPDAGVGVESVVLEVTVDVDDRELQEELMEHAYQEFVGEEGNLVSQAIQQSHERLRSYGSEHSYAVENIEQSFTGVDVSEGSDTLAVGWGWEHPATAYMERGTSDHLISGSPVLSFVWSDPPAWAEERFEAEGDGVRAFLSEVSVSGLPESRFVEAGIDWLESEVGT